MKIRAAATTFVLIALAVVWGGSSDQSGQVEIARLHEGNWSKFAPDGKEVDAIYGDIVLRNKYLTAVIAQPLANRHANMTVRDIAGALIDLTVREPQSDQLSAFYPERRRFPFRSWSAGIDGGAAQQVDDISELIGAAGQVSVVAEGTEDRPTVTVTYSLKADEPVVRVTTKYSNTTAKPLSIALEDDVRADAQKEDMQKTPNGVSRLFWVHDRFWQQAYGILADGMSIAADSNARLSVLKYQMEDGQSTVVLEPGQSFEFTRSIFPGNNLLDVKAVAESLRGGKTYPVQLALRDGEGQPIPRALVEFTSESGLFGSGTTGRDGLLKCRLPEGAYRFKATALGVVVGGASGELTLDVTPSTKSQELVVELDRYRPGRVLGEITDAAGEPIPCKVQFLAKEGTPQPEFGPESAEFAVRNLCYAPLGRFQQTVPPGDYEVIISRGPEYDAIFTELRVPPGKDVPLTGRLARRVQTPGWISSDFHSHSSPSGDNTGSQLGRVLNLVCEHIEFGPCTEHNRISSYEPHIESLKVDRFISTVSGMELTGSPLPLNHQNAFPLEYKPHTQDGGGPVTDIDPEAQIERIALWDDRSEKLIQQNHPDIGWLFFDRDGDGVPDGGFQRSFALMDVIEIHPVHNAWRLEPHETLPGRRGNNRIFNWLQLLNQGFRIPGVVNTDSHYNYHGSGGLRNWIQCSTDEPSEIDVMEIVRASSEGRLIMSNGPFLEVSLTEQGGQETVTAGQDLSAPSGNVRLQVRVQCPNWFDIDRVFVLINGQPHETHDYNKEEHPDLFRDGVVKFDRRLDLQLQNDAHVIVVAGGEKQTLGPVMGPFWGQAEPTAISNPIFVDVDGDGFQPNRDTLGHPLPVKFGTRQE